MKRETRRNRLLIGITGTPGTGKSYFARHLARRLAKNGVQPVLIEINDIVESERAFTGKDEFGSKIVSVRALSNAIKKRTGIDGVIILVGHLLPETKVNPDICVVLRLGLPKLARRLERRNYPVAKIRENLIAEAYDDIGMRISKMSKEVYEADTEFRYLELMAYILQVASGKKAVKPKKIEINKFDDIIKLVRNGNRYGM